MLSDRITIGSTGGTRCWCVGAPVDDGKVRWNLKSIVCFTGWWCGGSLITVGSGSAVHYCSLNSLMTLKYHHWYRSIWRRTICLRLMMCGSLITVCPGSARRHSIRFTRRCWRSRSIGTGCCCIWSCTVRFIGWYCARGIRTWSGRIWGRL